MEPVKKCFISFDCACWSTAVLVYHALSVPPLSRSNALIFVRLPADILRSIRTPEPLSLLKPDKHISGFLVSDLTSEQYETLWEFSAAFEDCCLTLAFDNENPVRNAIGELSPPKGIIASPRVKPEVFLSSPTNAALAIDLLQDGHAIDLAMRLPRPHLLSVWCSYLESLRSSPLDEVAFHSGLADPNYFTKNHQHLSPDTEQG